MSGGEQTVRPPEVVQRRARALGLPGERWLQDVPAMAGALARHWGLTLGEVLPGGSLGYVIAATTADGAAVVLKLHMPGWEDLESERRVLRLAAGRGYARLLRDDEAHGALLLERLGARLSDLGLPVARQIAITCATLQQAWQVSPAGEPFTTGAEKARWLSSFIAGTWLALGRPCAEHVIDRAQAYCAARAAAHDPARAVLVHGDAHAANLLAPFGTANPAAAGFRLVDPDGLFAERACDLAVPMREWSDDLLAGEPRRRAQERCALLGRLTGEDVTAIWQWGFMERVSSGLLLLQIGSEAEGRPMLQVAELLAAGRDEA